ncbi:MAG TPA: hypothetical protein VJR02_16410 [Pyrinomonadaceae bacterium]|nr:hypothetical protein [Pyrinomonadaceae bacterium]
MQIEFEGPSLELKIYAASDPASLVRQHALDAGPPFLPPKWTFTPWRWRDEHTQRTTYYDSIVHWGPGKPWGYAWWADDHSAGGDTSVAAVRSCRSEGTARRSESGMER